jgi:hypothetical protein
VSYFHDLKARWGQWEFWPAWFFNIPVFGIWLWFGLRSRNLLFFTRANPAIETGGLFGESKIHILQLLPEHVYPKTIFLPAGDRNKDDIRQRLTHQQLHYPVMVKPNVGERGFLAKKCKDEQTLFEHINQRPDVDFLLQAYIDFPEEYSVLYSRFPDAQSGRISSLCAKSFLSVTGDGRSTIHALMQRNDRSRFQIDRLLIEEPALLSEIPAKGELRLLEPVGNHCRGTAFLDACHLITTQLTRVFDDISQQTEGLLYGRFDLRCKSLDALSSGQDFAILEYNGVAAEPAHIYHPGRSIWKAYKDIYAHLHIVFRIAQAQKKKGVATESFGEVLLQGRKWWKHKNT